MLFSESFKIGGDGDSDDGWGVCVCRGGVMIMVVVRWIPRPGYGDHGDLVVSLFKDLVTKLNAAAPGKYGRRW